MELFQLALQGKVMLMYEYFLCGSVLDNAKDGFLEILRGLCDNPENRPIEFLETEYIYSAGNLFTIFRYSLISTMNFNSNSEQQRIKYYIESAKCSRPTRDWTSLPSQIFGSNRL